MRFSRIERAFKFFGRSLRAGLGSSAGATSVIAKARSMNRATDPKVVDAEALRGPVVGDFQPGRLRLQTLALMRYEPSTTLFHNRAVDGILTGAPAAF